MQKSHYFWGSDFFTSDTQTQRLSVTKLFQNQWNYPVYNVVLLCDYKGMRLLIWSEVKSGYFHMWYPSYVGFPTISNKCIWYSKRGCSIIRNWRFFNSKTLLTLSNSLALLSCNRPGWRFQEGRRGSGLGLAIRIHLPMRIIRICRIYAHICGAMSDQRIFRNRMANPNS